MARLFVLCLMLAASAAPAAAQFDAVSNRVELGEGRSRSPYGGDTGGATADGRGAFGTWGVFVGVDTYEDDKLSFLEGARHDAAELRRALVDTTEMRERESFLVVPGESSEGRPSMLTANQMRVQVHRAIEEIHRRSDSPHDVVLFYFAGHGATVQEEATGREMLVLCASDSYRALLSRTGVPFDEIVAMFDVLDVSVVHFILDCCNAGAAKPNSGAIEAEGTRHTSSGRRTLWAACAGGTASFEKRHGWKGPGDEWRPGGVFTTTIVAELNDAAHGRNDVAHGGVVDIQDLHREVGRALDEGEAGQRPVLAGIFSGDDARLGRVSGTSTVSGGEERLPLERLSRSLQRRWDALDAQARAAAAERVASLSAQL